MDFEENAAFRKYDDGSTEYNLWNPFTKYLYFFVCISY